MVSAAVWEGIGFAFAALSGVAIAIQSGVNATLGSHGGQAFASCMSFSTGLCTCLIFFAFDVTLRGTPLPSPALLKAAPAWSWLGGPLGAFFVASLIVFAPRVGAGSFIAVYVSLQLAAAVALDLLGAVGYVKRAFTWQRMVGVALMCVGVTLVTLYPGAPVDAGAKSPQGRPPVGRSLTHLFVRPGAGPGAGGGAAALPPRVLLQLVKDVSEGEGDAAA